MTYPADFRSAYVPHVSEMDSRVPSLRTCGVELEEKVV